MPPAEIIEQPQFGNYFSSTLVQYLHTFGFPFVSVCLFYGGNLDGADLHFDVFRNRKSRIKIFVSLSRAAARDKKTDGIKKVGKPITG